MGHLRDPWPQWGPPSESPLSIESSGMNPVHGSGGERRREVGNLVVQDDHGGGGGVAEEHVLSGVFVLASRVRVISSSVASSSSWWPLMVKLLEFCPRAMVSVLSAVEAGERRACAGHGYCHRHVPVGSWA